MSTPAIACPDSAFAKSYARMYLPISSVSICSMGSVDVPSDSSDDCEGRHESCEPDVLVDLVRAGGEEPLENESSQSSLVDDVKMYCTWEQVTMAVDSCQSQSSMN